MAVAARDAALLGDQDPLPGDREIRGADKTADAGADDDRVPAVRSLREVHATLRVGVDGSGAGDRGQLPRFADREPGDARRGLAGQARERTAGTDLDEHVAVQLVGHRAHRVRPAHRGRQLPPQELGPAVGTAVGAGIDVRHDRREAVQELGPRERPLERHGRRGHQRRMEGAAHRDRHDPRRPQLHGHRRAPLHSLGLARKDRLLRRVEICDPDPAAVLAHIRGGLLQFTGGQPEDHGHRAGRVRARLAHRLAARRDEPYAVLETDDTGRDERRVLAEAVARAHQGAARGGQDLPQLAQDHHLQDERGELRVVGAPQIRVVGAEQQFHHVTPGHLARPLGQEPAGARRPW